MKKRMAFSHSRILHIVLTCALVAVALVQTFTIVSGYGRVWVSRILRTYQLTSMERNALFFLGERGSQYWEFLDSTVPTDQAIVLPRQSFPFNVQSILQFFFMPRSIPECGCDEDPSYYSTACMDCLQKTPYYVPAIGGFPSPEVMQGWKKLITFTPISSRYHGVYAPLDAEDTGQPSLNEEPVSLHTAFAVDVFICALIFLLGYSISIVILRKRERIASLTAAIPIGIGSLTWIVFLLSWAGLPVTLLTFTVVYMALLALALAAKRSLFQDDKRILPNLSIPTLPTRKFLDQPVFHGILMLILLTFALQFVISIGRSYSLTDDMANWAIKGYAIALEGNVRAGQNWGAHSLAYPQNIPLMISLFKLADGDVLPGSKMIYSLMGASLIYGCYQAWRRRNVPGTIALLGVLIFSTVPIIFFQSTIGWGNYFFTAYIVLGTIYWAEGIVDRDQGRLGLGAVLLAFATWTRPEGVAFAAVLILGVLFTLWLKREKISIPKWMFLLTLIPSTYMVFSSTSMKSDEIGRVLGTFLRNTASWEFDFQPVSILASYSYNDFLDVDKWGYFMPLLLLMIVIALALRRKRIDLDDFILIIASLIAFLFPLGMFFVAYLDKGNKYVDFLVQSFDRAMMPFVILSIFTLLKSVAEPQEP